MTATRALAIWGVVLGGAVAHADGHRLRLATIAPEGTAWAREINAFARDVAAQSNGDLQVKWYFGGIAGDDVEMGQRMARGQLDGGGSAGNLCERISPTIRALRLLAHTRDEVSHSLSRLKTELDEEFRQAGFAFMGGAVLGPEIVFTRGPIVNWDDLKKVKVFVWDLDEVATRLFSAAGFTTVAMPVTEAARAYDDKRIDGFIGLPTAALAFQWSPHVTQFADLGLGYLIGCIFLTQRAWDTISVPSRAAFFAAGAKLQARMNEVGRAQDDELLSRLFVKQGLRPATVPPAMRHTVEAELTRALTGLGSNLVPAARLQRVRQILDEYRQGGAAR